MDNRDIRRHSLKNFVYVGDEMEVDSSVLLGMAYRYQHRMKKVPRAIRKQGREAYTQFEDHPISCANDLGSVAFADDFLYYVSKDNPVFSHSGKPKTTSIVPCDFIDPNSEDGCNIDLSEFTVDVAAIPQPSKNYIISRRCRELVLRIFMPLLMLFALPMLNSCNDKPENPTPPTPQPDPTDTIVIPTKEKVFDVDWNEDPAFAPSVDSIKKYTDNPEYKYVFINFMNKGSPRPDGLEGMSCEGYPARAFKLARDTLQTRIDINPKKVRGSGKIILQAPGSASLPEDELGMPGMRALDSVFYVQNGWMIVFQLTK